MKRRQFQAGYRCGLSLMVSLVMGAVQAQSLAEPAAAPVTTFLSVTTPFTDPVLSAVQDELPEAITRQRQALAAQRRAVFQAELSQQTACWQKFAVNACLSEARRTRRQALEPLRQQELALNAQERLWRTAQRDKRLQDKRVDSRETP